MLSPYERIKSNLKIINPDPNICDYEAAQIIVLVELVEVLKSIDRKTPDFRKPGAYRGRQDHGPG